MLNIYRIHNSMQATILLTFTSNQTKYLPWYLENDECVIEMPSYNFEIAKNQIAYIPIHGFIFNVAFSRH